VKFDFFSSSQTLCYLWAHMFLPCIDNINVVNQRTLELLNQLRLAEIYQKNPKKLRTSSVYWA